MPQTLQQPNQGVPGRTKFDAVTDHLRLVPVRRGVLYTVEVVGVTGVTNKSPAFYLDPGQFPPGSPTMGLFAYGIHSGTQPTAVNVALRTQVHLPENGGVGWQPFGFTIGTAPTSGVVARTTGASVDLAYLSHYFGAIVESIVGGDATTKYQIRFIIW